MVNVDNRPGGPRGSNNTLYFIVGALVIAVLIIGYFLYGGDDAVDDADVNVTTEEPAIADDADDVDVPDVDVDVDAPAADAPAPAAPAPADEPDAPEPEPAAPATPEPAPATPPAAPAPQ